MELPHRTAIQLTNGEVIKFAILIIDVDGPGAAGGLGSEAENRAIIRSGSAQVFAHANNESIDLQYVGSGAEVFPSER